MKPATNSAKALSPLALMRRALTRGFRRNERGAVAVEFALLALPFFAIIGAIMETSFFFLSSQLLDSAVDTSARLLRTGQAQTQDFTITDFRDSICDGLFGLFTCEKLHIKVEKIGHFVDANFSYPLDVDPLSGETSWNAEDVYSPGSGRDIIVVRVFYKWPTTLDILGFNLSNAGTGYRLMASARVFMNEPFS